MIITTNPNQEALAPPASWEELGGLWVHQGIPEPGADLTRIVQDVREEHIASVLGVCLASTISSV